MAKKAPVLTANCRALPSFPSKEAVPRRLRPERAFQTSAAGCCPVVVIAPTDDGNPSNKRSQRPPTGTVHEVHVLELSERRWTMVLDQRQEGMQDLRLLLVAGGQQRLQGAQEHDLSLVTGSVTPELG